MSAPPPPALAGLDDYLKMVNHVRSVHKTLHAIVAARGIADRCAVTAADSIRMPPYPNDTQRLNFARAHDLIVAEERAAGEIAQRRELRRLATELEKLRQELPVLAVAARFALLDVVREYRS